MSYYITVGAGRDSWSFADPTSDRVVQACRRARFATEGLTPPFTTADALVMASVIENFAYLLRTAPSDKAAVDKLRAMRKALRGAGPGTGETGGAT